MTTPNVAGLIDRLRALAEARATAARLGEQLKARQEAFENETRELRTQLSVAKDDVAGHEMMVRTRAVEIFKATGQKKPAPGVEIKVGKVYQIDQAAALVWAKEKQMCLVPESLDIAAVQKIATVQPLPFVTISDEPKPQIAKDLDKALLDAPDITAEAPVAAIATSGTGSSLADEDLPF